MSIDAAGTIYNALTASIWKGRNYIRGYFRPTNPRTGAQVVVRQILRDAVAAWQALGAVMPQYYTGEEELYKDQWNLAARDVYPPISGFNYYVMQYCLTGAPPNIPAIAPKKAKSIHGGEAYTLPVTP